MSRYSRTVFDSETENWHMAMLAFSFWQLTERDGWAIRDLPAMGVSLLWPERAYVADAESQNFLNFRHTASSLSISIGIHDNDAAQGIHDYTWGTHELASKPYVVRKSHLAVTSATKRDGSTLYARSDRVNGSWSTIMLYAGKQDGPILNAVAASIAVGHAPPLNISSGGPLEDAIRKTVAVFQEEDSTPDQRSVAERAPSNPPDSNAAPGSGSGFVVSADGHVLTNAHVVQGCRELRVDGQPAELVSISEEFDLALLESTPNGQKSVAVFSATSARLNSDITAVGFPYAGLLGGLNVTRGSVSSLKGLGGDATTMQITAPIQSGNSGGPLLSSDGEVVGVVVSKLDAEKVADALGDVPQNVNFAIRGEIAKLFLSQNGVDPEISLDDDKLEPEVLAARAKDFTSFVECN